MKKKLQKINEKIYYFENDKKILGRHKNILGYVSYIRGDISNLSGNVSHISGDLDDCEISEEERSKGVNINDLLK